MDRETRELERAAEEAAAAASSYGLDFGEVEIRPCSAEDLRALAVYGLPGRFAHWSFGRAYRLLRALEAQGLQRIYELVTNTRPVRVYLLRGAGRVQNLAIVAHALAHADFFRHNSRFRTAGAGAPERFAAHAQRIAALEARHGREAVEELLDAALAVREQVRPSAGDAGPSGDLLLFLAARSPGLADWQREVLLMLREEMLYFWPFSVTKIANEGWATYWHTRLMRHFPLAPHEAVEWAQRQAELLRCHPPDLNPYAVGLALFRAVAGGRAPAPVPDGLPPEERLFRLREFADDALLVRHCLTPDLVAELDLFVYRLVGRQWVVTHTAEEWEAVREALVRRCADGGRPVLEVLDADHRGRGELYVRHLHDGRDLAMVDLERVLIRLFYLWGRPVHLETTRGGQAVVFGYDGLRAVNMTVRASPGRQEKEWPRGSI